MRAAASISILLLAMLTSSTRVAAFSPLPQGDQAEALLAQMTPEERIGQLFLLTFEGSRLQPDDPILALIRDNHISGVVFRSGNNNIVGPDVVLSSRAQPRNAACKIPGTRAITCVAVAGSRISGGTPAHPPRSYRCPSIRCDIAST